MSHLVLYTDGSGTVRGNPGGWAFILEWHGAEVATQSGGLHDATNNSAELTAVLQGIRFIAKMVSVRGGVSSIEVVSDSEYVVKGINTHLANWAAKGFRRNAPNLSLWESIWHYKQQYHITARWVRGHQGHPQNERCDTLANLARTAEVTRRQLTPTERAEL